MAFVSNIKVGESTNGLRAVAIPSGQVDSTSTETAFTATVPGITELKHGVCCFIKNGVVTSAANCTLNINGLGAKPIYSSMAAASAISTVFNINYTMLFVYDETRVTGGCWMLYYGYNAGYTNNLSQGQCYGTCSTAASTKAKTVSMSSYALVAHGICAIKFTNGNTAANATLNINSKGAKAIYWNGAACPTNLIKANDVVLMVYSTQYHIVGIYNGNRGFATTTPVMNGTGAIGTSTEYARADHVHPTDTSRAPIASPALTGTPTAPTPDSTNTDAITNVGWVNSQITSAFANYDSTVVAFVRASLYPFSPSINDTFSVTNFISGNRISYSQLAGFYLAGAQTYTAGVLIDDSQTNEIVDSFPILPIGMGETSISFQGIYKNKLITFLVTPPENSEYCYATITDIYEIGATAGAMHFKGRALQTLTDGGTENAASSSGSPYTGEAGDVYLQSGTDTNEEYVWVKLGDAAGYWEKLGGDSYATLTEVQTEISNTLTNTTSEVITGQMYEGAILINLTNCSPSQLYNKYTSFNDTYLIITVIDMMDDPIYTFELRPSSITNNTLNFYGISGTSLIKCSCQITTGSASAVLSVDSTVDLTAVSSHAHGNITNVGAVTTTTTVASNDRILITDNSDSNKVKGGPAFNTASTTYYLNAAGNWTVPVGDHKVTQAAAITTNGNYPILLGNTTATTAITATVNKASTLVYNPSTKKLLVNSATVATVADIPTWTVS